MPWIDTSFLTLDPDFATKFIVVRRMESVNGYGESTLAETRIPNCVGIIVPAGNQSVKRDPNFTKQDQGISLVTRFRLVGVEEAKQKNIQPDLVLFGIDYYIVNTSNDYAQYGAGWIIASLTLYPYTSKQDLST